MIRQDRQLFICIALFAISFLALLTQSSCAHREIQNALTIQTKEGPRVFHIEMAERPEELEKGLMERTSLPQDAGMLFKFGAAKRKVFWMKDTLIPLDMIFIAEDGTIHHIHHMARPLDRTRITSERPAMAVLEINGGLADTLGIVEGDKVIHPYFRNQFEE